MPFAPPIGDCQREGGGENLVMGRRLSGGLGLLSFSVLSAEQWMGIARGRKWRGREEEEEELGQ